eukprot:scaffold190311_cov27-Tisochrysis_lutea.AAC.1
MTSGPRISLMSHHCCRHENLKIFARKWGAMCDSPHPSPLTLTPPSCPLHTLWLWQSALGLYR